MLISEKVGFSYAFFHRYFDYFCGILVAIHTLNGNAHSSDFKTCSHPLLLMHFPSVYFRTSVTVKETFIKTGIFPDQHRLYWNETSHLKKLLFRKNNFFRTPSCLEQLLLSKNYFFLTNTFSDQLLLEDSTSLAKIREVISEKLFLQNKYLCRTCTFSKQAVLVSTRKWL